MTDRLGEEVAAALGVRMRHARPLGGGCIGEVYRVDLSDGSRLVAKVDPDRAANLQREAYMLRYLREKSQLPVPEVYHDSPTLLLMEFIQGDGGIADERVQEHGADLLAALHGITADHFGHERDTLIGSLDQPNPPNGSWVDFFREQRLLYLARVANESGRLPEATRHRLERFAGTLEERLPEPERPALIHGDVWSGNVVAKDGRVAAFLDPAIYYADPEIELSFIHLFNSFSGPFFTRYREVRGLREGFEERAEVYNLYPLLVHTHFFGGGYRRAVEATLERFGF